MEPRDFTATSKGLSLPLSSLRLVVPPVQLVTASMWQVLKAGDAMSYWSVADFISLVMDAVPELLRPQHRTQLDLGLRARYILELCRPDTLESSDLVLPLLERMKSQRPSLTHASEEEEATTNFLDTVRLLLKDPEERRNFFSEVFPADYGPDYDRDLQMLFWEFLCRLTQLLPVPDLQQTVSWLSAGSSVFDDCVRSVSEATDLKDLLRHHRNLGHLEQHVPPSSMGDSILSSLSAAPPGATEPNAVQAGQPELPRSLAPDAHAAHAAHAAPFLGDVAVEVIAVTDYAEIELGTSSIEVVLDESCEEGSPVAAEADGSEVSRDDAVAPGHKANVGPHDCPDCEKKFRFASSLTAHRVIHTGERPHRCADCGRCFSFRQSLDRHRRTHQTARKYDCALCGESFPSSAARAQHKQSHAEDGVYACRQCGKRFNWDLALARHLKSHAEHDDREAVARAEGCGGAERQVPLGGDVGQEAETQSGARRASEDLSSDAGAHEDHGDATSEVRVRTSGRKRRPTLKIQVINLQKRMATKKRRETPVDAAALRPEPFNSVEHSYGSTALSTNNVAEGAPAAFSCPQCSYQHSEEARVQQHINKVHRTNPAEDAPAPQDEEGHYTCGDCEKSFRFRSLLKAHQRSHTGEQPFLCAQCGQRFSFKQSLERHKQTHKSGRKYECLICGEAFESLAAQREHKSSHMENGEFLCSECGRGFAWKSALVRHLKTHGAEADGAERSLPCPRCELSFSGASGLSRHLQTHREERPHACNCGKSFAYRAALVAHQRTHQERPHACAQCGKGFLYKGGLLSHMKIHSEEMPFMCSFCGKSFKRERNMKKHERCHTRENVFGCSQCDKSFVYKATLVRHELTHSGERPFLCSDCGKGFFSHAELLKHERFHTGHKPFQCPYCGKSFTQSCYLTVHLRYHTGARPYSCGECDKSFLSANRLKRHQRIHSGEKPYLCVECGKGFRQSYNLKIHQRTHVLTLA